MDQSALRNTTNGEFCVCVLCGTRVPCQDWTTCPHLSCSNCGSIMVRDNTFQLIFSIRPGSASGSKIDSTGRPTVCQDRHHPCCGECELS